MAYIQLLEHPRGALRQFAWWQSRRMMGDVVDPVRAAARHTGVLVTMGAMEMTVARGWRQLDPGLRWLVVQAVSERIGCPWCTDFGRYEALRGDMALAKVQELRSWRGSDVYVERERCALEFAEAATGNPAELPASVVSRLQELFSVEQIVELAGWVALENYRSRFNAALGLTSQGFESRCRTRLGSAGG